MRFTVDGGRCIGCGMCVATCPGIFKMTGAGVARAEEREAGREELPKARMAEAGCPVNAIGRA